MKPKKMVPIFLVWLAAFLFLSGNLCLAQEIPRRDTQVVDDVYQPYNADWIVSPDEETKGETETEVVPETDIRGAIACNDSRYLRVDILLHNSVTYKWKVWYAVRFQYTDMYEVYTYYPDTDKFIYEEEVDGKIVKTIDLKKDSIDSAGVTDSASTQKNDNVYFIIHKENHIDGVKGKRYFLTTTFSSGYVDTNKKIQTTDKTIAVDIEFEY